MFIENKSLKAMLKIFFLLLIIYVTVFLLLGSNQVTEKMLINSLKQDNTGLVREINGCEIKTIENKNYAVIFQKFYNQETGELVMNSMTYYVIERNFFNIPKFVEKSPQDSIIINDPDKLFVILR